MTNEEKIYNLIKLIASKLDEKFEFNCRIQSYRMRATRYRNSQSLLECYRFSMSFNQSIVLSVDYHDEKSYNICTLCNLSQIMDKDILSMSYFEYSLNHNKIDQIMRGILHQTIIDYDLIYNFIKDIERPIME